jgi:hypothetical protein
LSFERFKMKKKSKLNFYFFMKSFCNVSGSSSL